MKDQEMANMPTEDIKQKISINTGISIGFIVLFVFILLSSGYLVFIKGNMAFVGLMVIPACMAPILISIGKNNSKLKEELAKRS
ncbi:hypothetical protein [Fulvivirga lutea]|uniref:Redox-active disulfide protein 2 n=1 Tax=Fulvivirga lutea TaxID=2810512 RepID=A0A975A059_9BACT|nr:hypothetical protein [Fulvivirga lutea]QSE97044.1 hypothetical protein JR347_15830 [Fulvivirga lutea]